MDKCIYVWLEKIRPRLPRNLGKILDVGSLDVNGSMREILKRTEYESYTGIDIRAGKNVDIVMNSHDLVKTFGLNSFDTVISIATMEHDDKFWITQSEINSVIKKGGFYILCVPTIGFHYHPYPHDFWRFTHAAVLSFMFYGYKVFELKDIGNNLLCGFGRI